MGATVLWIVFVSLGCVSIVILSVGGKSRRESRPPAEDEQARPPRVRTSFLQLGATAVLLLAVVVLAIVAVRARSANARLERRVHELTDAVDDLDSRVQQLEQR